MGERPFTGSPSVPFGTRGRGPATDQPPEGKTLGTGSHYLPWSRMSSVSLPHLSDTPFVSDRPSTTHRTELESRGNRVPPWESRVPDEVGATPEGSKNYRQVSVSPAVRRGFWGCKVRNTGTPAGGPPVECPFRDLCPGTGLRRTEVELINAHVSGTEVCSSIKPEDSPSTKPPVSSWVVLRGGVVQATSLLRTCGPPVVRKDLGVSGGHERRRLDFVLDRPRPSG